MVMMAAKALHFASPMDARVYIEGQPIQCLCRTTKEIDHFDTHEAGYSCLHPDAFLWFKESYLGGEYNGLLLAQAALMMQSSLTTNPLPVWLLPWGVLSLSYDFVSWNPFPWFAPPGIPAPNCRIAANVFPVLDQGLESNLRLENTQQTLMESVEALLDALYALVLAHSLGLAHQDIQGKNIAVRQHNNSYSVLLADNTFLSQRGPCSHSRLCSRICPNLFVQGIRNRRSFPLDMPEMERDVQNFCSQLLLPVLLDGREQNATNQLRSRLETGGAVSASHLVEVLQDWRRESQLQLQKIHDS